jgi:dihydrofolate reductase
MRKVVVSMNVSLNGCMAGPKGELDWHYHLWNKDMARATAMHLGDADTILFGRVTYEAMAGYWMAKGRKTFGPREDLDFAEMMNGYVKIVFSKTLKATHWQNSRLAKRSIAKEITKLKEMPGKDIIIYGSGKVVAALSKGDLVDEYRLWVHPVVLIKGRPLFKEITAGLEFAGKEAFSTGVVLMTYKPCRFG